MISNRIHLEQSVKLTKYRRSTYIQGDVSLMPLTHKMSETATLATEHVYQILLQSVVNY